MRLPGSAPGLWNFEGQRGAPMSGQATTSVHCQSAACGTELVAITGTSRNGRLLLCCLKVKMSPITQSSDLIQVNDERDEEELSDEVMATAAN